MIRGEVVVRGRDGPLTYLQPCIEIGVAGSDGVFRTLSVVVDTGFTGWLTLPPALIRELGLQHRGNRDVRLADGQERPVDLYAALIAWDGQILPRIVHQSDSTPLIGMYLMTGYHLAVDVREGGAVTLSALPSAAADAPAV